MLESTFRRNHEKYTFWCKWTCQFISNGLYIRCIICIIQFYLCTFILSVGKLEFLFFHYICLFICLFIYLFIYLLLYLFYLIINVFISLFVYSSVYYFVPFSIRLIINLIIYLSASTYTIS